MKTQKKIKMWSGIGRPSREDPDKLRFDGRVDVVRYYVGAYSIKDACLIIKEYDRGSSITPHQISKYFSPAWGNTMNGIQLERGLWITYECPLKHGFPPKRVV